MYLSLQNSARGDHVTPFWPVDAGGAVGWDPGHLFKKSVCMERTLFLYSLPFSFFLSGMDEMAVTLAAIWSHEVTLRREAMH